MIKYKLLSAEMILCCVKSGSIKLEHLQKMRFLEEKNANLFLGYLFFLKQSLKVT